MSQERKLNNNHLLSFTKKCILMSRIALNNELLLLNNFNNISIVKLYIGNSKQENFIYSKIKGILCLFKKNEANSNKKQKQQETKAGASNETNDKNYCLQIYDANNFSLSFELELNETLLKEYKHLENSFYYLNTFNYCFGFKFYSEEEAKIFYGMINNINQPNQTILNQNLESMKMASSNKLDKEIKKIKDEIKSQLSKQLKSLPKDDKKNTNNPKNNNLNFFLINDLSKLLNNIEFDEKNNRFNIFIYKNINKNLIKEIISEYSKIKNSDKEIGYPIKIIYNDYTHILNKNIYIEFLTSNVISNLNEFKIISIYRRKYLKKDENEIEKEMEELKKINSEYDSGNNKFRASDGLSNNNRTSNKLEKMKLKNTKTIQPVRSNNISDTIREEKEEDNDDKMNEWDEIKKEELIEDYNKK